MQFGKWSHDGAFQSSTLVVYDENWIVLGEIIKEDSGELLNVTSTSVVKMSSTKFVLVVEDDDEIRSLIVSSLKAESAETPLTVFEARDGHEAIQMAGRQEFHCVVTDLNMPRTSGQDLIRVLLGESLNANTPTVVVSAGIDDQFLAAFQGVRTVSKPFCPTALSQLVLREIKLGRMDERIPAHMLNPFAEAMQSILVDEMHLGMEAVSIVAPSVRRAGVKLDGDLMAMVTLTTGIMQTKIAFAFDRGFLLQMKSAYFQSRRSQWAAMNLELLVRYTVVAMIEKAGPSLIAIFGQPPRVADITLVELSDHMKAADYIRCPGVTVALSTEQGRVFILALAQARAKRGNA